MLSQLTQDKRKQVREELEWQGFGAISPVVLACPRSDRTDVNATLLDLGAQEETIVFETTAQDVLASKALRLQVRESWNIEELATHYSEFIQLFRPLWQALREQENLQPADCFLARILADSRIPQTAAARPAIAGRVVARRLGRARSPAVVPQHLPFDLRQGRGMAEQCTGNRRRTATGCRRELLSTVWRAEIARRRSGRVAVQENLLD